MGLRGAHHSRSSTSNDLNVTDAALSLYRKMRQLDRQCECLPIDELKKTGSLWTTRTCPACQQWWRLNGELNDALGTCAFPVYEDVENPLVTRDYKPDQSAIDRFYALEKAATKAKKERKFKYKWED